MIVRFSQRITCGGTHCTLRLDTSMLRPADRLADRMIRRPARETLSSSAWVSATVQDLASKQKEWSAHQSSGGGVSSGGAFSSWSRVRPEAPPPGPWGALEHRLCARQRHSGVDAATPEKPGAGAPDITLLDQNNFYDALSSAGDSLVVVDFFTDWCAAVRRAASARD